MDNGIPTFAVFIFKADPYMTKAEVVAAIMTKTGIDHESTERVIEQFFKTVTLSLEKGEDVYIRGFGTFLVKKRNTTTGRNIKKNTVLVIPEHFIPAFRPAQEFKDKVKIAVLPKKHFQPLL
jgi:DNA-binding protein HU-beta